jgi:fucose permease
VLFAEGAVDNWSGIYVHTTLGATLATAPYGVAASGAGMAFGRFCGDWLIARWGRRPTLERCAVLAAIGLATTLVTSSPILAVAGYAVFGLGLSTIVPIVFSLAGNVQGVQPAWAISRVTTIGFVGFLSAAPVIGLLAGATDLRLALGVAALLVCLVLPLSVLAQRVSARGQAVSA